MVFNIYSIHLCCKHCGKPIVQSEVIAQGDLSIELRNVPRVTLPCNNIHCNGIQYINNTEFDVKVFDIQQNKYVEVKYIL